MYYVPVTNKVIFEVRNNLGQRILMLEENATSGINTIDLDVNGLPAGIYYYSLEYKGERLSKKMIITR